MGEQIEHVKMICNAYNKFREHLGLTPDYTPVVNLYEDGGKLIHINDDEDDTEWTCDIIPEIQLPFSFNPCDTDDEIIKKLGVFQKKVLNSELRHWTCLRWATDANGKKRNWAEIEMNLERSLIAIQMKNDNSPYSAIAKKLNLEKSDTDKGYKNADREAKRLFLNGQLLAESIETFDSFCKASIKPLPRNI